MKETGATRVEDLNISEGKLQEPVDILWNNLKLANVSRKHGYLGLAYYYLNQVKTPLTHKDTVGDLLKVERFKYYYESFKLQVMI